MELCHPFLLCQLDLVPISLRDAEITVLICVRPWDSSPGNAVLHRGPPAPPGGEAGGKGGIGEEPQKKNHYATSFV